MSQVYLGNSGLVQLTRTVDESGFIAKIVPSDINNQRRRFSYDYVGGLGGGVSQPDEDDKNTIEMQYVPLISGDRVRFQRVFKNSDGDWVPSSEDQYLLDGQSTRDNDFVAYVNVDGMYGIRLYESFELAVNNYTDSAEKLYDSRRAPAEQYFRVTAGQSDAYRGLAAVTNYEFTTSREAIDLTSLGKNYRRYFTNGLLSGQGVLDCYFLRDDICEEEFSDDCESARYLAELILRLEEGAVFASKFILDAQPRTGRTKAKSIFYECNKCMITSVAVTVEPTALVRARINFVTSGPFSLRYQFLPAYLLTEGIARAVDGALLQENEFEIEILDDDD